MFGFPAKAGNIAEGTTVNLNVTRTFGTVGTATVNWSAVAGSATAADFTAAGGTLTFVEGDGEETISFVLTDDSIFEFNETFAITLTDPSSDTFVNPARQTFTVTILDNETLAVEISDVEVVEGDSGSTPALFTVTLSQAVTMPITVQYHTSQGSAVAIFGDYEESSGTLVFQPGETVKTFTSQVLGETFYERDENFFVFGSVVGSEPAIAVSMGECTILNDDPKPVLTITDAVVTETDGISQATFTISISSPVFADVSYSFLPGSAGYPNDFGERFGHVSFDLWTTSHTVTVPIVGDNEAEPTEEFYIEFLPNVNTVVVPARPRATITILNDDTGVAPVHQSLAVGESATYQINLGAPAPATSTIALSVTGSGITAPASITVQPGQTQASFDVVGVAEGSAGVTIVLPPSLGGDTFAVTATVYTARTIVFTPSDVSLSVGETAEISASLSPASDQSRTITLDSKSDAISAPATIVIPAGGSTTFEIKGVHEGPIAIHASADGHTTSYLFGHVFATPVTISGIVPNFGNVAGGTEVRIAGTHFDAGCWPSFGGIPAPQAIVEPDGSITATVPAHTATTVEVSLQCTGGAAVRPDAFAYTEAPEPPASIGTVEPLIAAPGAPVTIGGLRFRSTDHITFGTLAATILSTRAGQHVVSVPELPPGPISITITDANGHVTTTGPIFTVLEPD
jgi:hypothetical protein